ncbi:MAG: transglutaminaseTgpA domain-containing protein [bacterium]|nr:transglutaminaseTgpA domain-containing protein [bacterium]
MTTLSRQVRPPRRMRPPNLQRIGRRLVTLWHSLFAPGDLPTLIISVILLLMPAFSLNAAGWLLDMNTLIPVIVLSVVFGFLLARSQYNELVGLLIGAIYGGCLILLIAAINAPGDLGSGLYEVFTRSFQWLSDAVSGGINQDELVFTLLVAGLFWFLGYNLIWHLFRIDRVWRAVLPPALILITNSVYYTGSASLDMYLILFTFFTLLLIVRSNMEMREWEWYTNGMRVPRSLRNQVFRAGMVLAFVILSIAWLIPQNDAQDRLRQFQEFLASDPLIEMSELWNRLFASAETQGPTTADYYGGDSLQLGGAIRLGADEVFHVSTPPTRRYYWRSRVFDQYDNGRWTSAADIRLTDPEAPLDVVQEAYVTGSRVPVQQEFIMGLGASRLVYYAAQPSRIDLATRADLRYTGDSVNSMAISVVRPLRVLYQGDSYTVTSLISTASADQLRAAGTNYPVWVTNTYHGYIPTMTSRTVNLARQIVTEANATTPYDQARAVEAWLRVNITYNELIPTPPEGQDPIDWVLFDYREGYCNYYASAMVLMLRSLGVPARMAAGFSQGEWNAGLNSFVVRERDAHTWVEVYFPGYGWVDFEPTSAQAPLNRGDIPPTPESFPTNTPLPPTNTPTPLPTDTPPPTSTPEGQPTDAVGVQPPDVQATPTLTPSPTPTPTPTPFVLPTQPPPERPQPRSALSFILPALGVVFGLLMFTLALIVTAFLIYWWWEWRGMRGMNPIVRAYARLERYIGLLGIRTRAEQTPEERRQVIIGEIPAAEPPITAITRLYTAERYGTPRRSPAQQSKRDENADRAWTDTRSRIVRRWAKRTFLPFLPDDRKRGRRRRRSAGE